MDIQQLASSSHCATLPNVGGDAGTLILFTSPTLVGNWIDLIPLSGKDPKVRAVVCERDLPQGVSFAAVYPRLRQGLYFVRDSEQKVAIRSGFVTTLDYVEDCCRIYHHPATETVLALCSNNEDEVVTVDNDDSCTLASPYTPEVSAKKATAV